MTDHLSARHGFGRDAALDQWHLQHPHHVAQPLHRRGALTVINLAWLDPAQFYETTRHRFGREINAGRRPMGVLRKCREA